ncbi:MAG: SHOCT domain-containing protein, partial [Allobaculum sp.]|nr:SHOCT domain-containing protein [Allobaculum sp.]
IYGVKHSEVMISKVNAISFKNGMMVGEIYIEDGASTRIIKSVDKKSTKPFVDAVHKAMEMQSGGATIVHQQSSSVADEILKFKKLLDMGAITEEEFERQKNKLLN